MIYYHGGTLVQSSANIDYTARTTRQIAEVQRDSYEALAENLLPLSAAASGSPKAGSSS